MNHKKHVIGGMLLVTGTTIGAGMLALPILTSLGGFFPSILVFVACWLFMAATGLLILEVCLWMNGESNLVSMAKHTLGPFGQAAAWGLYLFMFYCITIAYVSGGGELVQDLVDDRISHWTGTLFFVGFFAPFVWIGAGAVDRINRLFMVGLAISYFAFLIFGFKHVRVDFLFKKDWGMALVALPIAFASFGYQGIVPTLTAYMQFDIRRTRIAIIVGSFIPLVAYILWEWLIIGMIPVEGPGGLAEALAKNYTALRPLKTFLTSPSVFIAGEFFAFFALVTSFLGVTLGLFDFLADGLHIKKNKRGRTLLFFLVFSPPTVISLLNPGLFIVALRYAGGFGVALLLGLLPILMVWSGRYRMKLKGMRQLPGGRWVLGILILFVLVEVGMELRHLIAG